MIRLVLALTLIVGTVAARAADTDYRLEQFSVRIDEIKQSARLLLPDNDGSPAAAWIISVASTEDIDALMNNRPLIEGTISNGRALVVLEPVAGPLAIRSLAANATINSLVSQQRIDPERVYLIGFEDGARIALDLALTAEITPRGVVAFAGHPALLPSQDATAVTTTFLVGERDPRASMIASEANAWARGFGCSTQLKTKSQTLIQRGHYGCRDDATVIFASINNYGADWPGGVIDLHALIGSFFDFYAN